MWAIIETKENNKRMISTVPMKWVNAQQKLLYWPEKMSPTKIAEAIRTNKDVYPGWSIYHCKLLMSNIGKFIEPDHENLLIYFYIYYRNV